MSQFIHNNLNILHLLSPHTSPGRVTLIKRKWGNTLGEIPFGDLAASVYMKLHQNYVFDINFTKLYMPLSQKTSIRQGAYMFQCNESLAFAVITQQ